jgi:hypothetical protein
MALMAVSSVRIPITRSDFVVTLLCHQLRPSLSLMEPIACFSPTAAEPAPFTMVSQGGYLIFC